MAKIWTIKKWDVFWGTESIPPESSSVVFMINSKPVSICDRFHAKLVIARYIRA